MITRTKNKYKRLYKERKELGVVTCKNCIYNGNNMILEGDDTEYADNYCKVMRGKRREDYAPLCRFLTVCAGK